MNQHLVSSQAYKTWQFFKRLISIYHTKKQFYEAQGRLNDYNKNLTQLEQQCSRAYEQYQSMSRDANK